MTNKVTLIQEVPKELHEVNVALLAFVAAVHKALADGWQPGQDVPVIVSAAISNMLPALDGMSQVPGELAENSPGAVASGGWLVAEMLKLFKQPKAA